MRTHQKFLTTTVAAISLFVAACGSPASLAPAPTSTPAAATTAATPAGNATVVAITTASPSSQAAVHYSVVANGTTADYRVREQLAKLTAPSDAVGTTSGVTGDIVIGSDGKIVSEQSKLVVDLTSLKSDSGMRDGYIQRSTLDTAQYPTATFVPTAIKGLASPLPTSGQQTFQLVGNLTIHGVTKPVTFDVTTQVNGSNVTGKATTDVTFEDFGMSPPQTMAVLSVVDDVKLELSLNLVKSA